MDDYLDLVKDASVLLVGAGGIGCEVIKNLVLCGVRKLVIVDLDTVDISNLNRQFLYQRRHVSMHKSVVACERATEVAPGTDITSMVCNVLEWKAQDVAPYDVVLSALDNIKARSHLNYCCIRAGVPLIESGSSGLNGQVYPIVKRVTKCYECQDKPRSKSLPVCTIRQIPEKSDHCIAWGRKLYELLFGPPDEGNVLNDLEIAKLPKDGSIQEEAALNWTANVFVFLFKTQIEELAELKKDWPEGKKPVPIDYPLGDVANEHCNGKEVTNDGQKKKKRKVAMNAEGGTKHVGIKQKMRLCNIEELATQFRDSVLHMLLKDWQLVGRATFDKDDPVCIQFVSAAANLRMINFHIPQVNMWDVQSIAGSIIPAIAATNAIVAAMQVLQMVHLLSAKRAAGGSVTKDSFEKSNCRFVWIKGGTTGSAPLVKGALSNPEPLDPPNPKCVICQQDCVKLELHDLGEWTLQQIVDRIFKPVMGMEMLSMDFKDGNIYDSEFIQEDEAYAKKAMDQLLSAYGIDNGAMLTVTCLNTGKQVDVQFVVDVSVAPGEFSFIGYTA